MNWLPRICLNSWLGIQFILGAKMAKHLRLKCNQKHHPNRPELDEHSAHHHLKPLQILNAWAGKGDALKRQKIIQKNLCTMISLAKTHAMNFAQLESNHQGLVNFFAWPTQPTLLPHQWCSSASTAQTTTPNVRCTTRAKLGAMADSTEPFEANVWSGITSQSAWEASKVDSQSALTNIILLDQSMLEHNCLIFCFETAICRFDSKIIAPCSTLWWWAYLVTLYTSPTLFGIFFCISPAHVMKWHETKVLFAFEWTPLSPVNMLSGDSSHRFPPTLPQTRLEALRLDAKHDPHTSHSHFEMDMETWRKVMDCDDLQGFGLQPGEMTISDSWPNPPWLISTHLSLKPSIQGRRRNASSMRCRKTFVFLINGEAKSNTVVLREAGYERWGFTCWLP